MVFAAGTMSYLYKSSNIISSNITYANPGVYQWTSSTYGNVTCTLKGAAGGGVKTIVGGNGAVLTFSFPVRPNDVYSIFIGVMPVKTSNNNSGNGGGGASAVTLGNTILAIAGAGGGAGGTNAGGGSSGLSNINIVSPNGTVYSGANGTATTIGWAGYGGYTTGGAQGNSRTSVNNTVAITGPSAGTQSKGGIGALISLILPGGNGYIVSSNINGIQTSNIYNISGGASGTVTGDNGGGGGGGGWFGGGGGGDDSNNGNGNGGGAGSSFISSICTNISHAGACNTASGTATFILYT